MTHFAQFTFVKTFAKVGCQTGGQVLQNTFTVSGTHLTMLLMFYDGLAYHPIALNHRKVYGMICTLTSICQYDSYIGIQLLYVVRYSLYLTHDNWALSVGNHFGINTQIIVEGE